ncbi:MAG: PilT/PilU family type 4a pilus ATPase [Candidatus Sumerlaeia bacterium]|nr:PilT/PilU family type 4a pilus ATPase [Candidatus Sumerlaeia bacterium]
MNQSEEVLLDLARNYRFLTPAQALEVRGEADATGAYLADLLLGRMLLTQKQLKKLQNEVQMYTGSAAPSTEVEEAPPEPAPAPVTQAAPAAAPAAAKQPAAAAAPKQGASQPQQQPAQQQAAPAQQQAPAPAPEPKAAPVSIIEQYRHFPPAPDLLQLLRIARAWEASDLHLSVGKPPFVRLAGQLFYMEYAPISPERSEQLNFSALTKVQAELLREKLSLDFALQIPADGRYRCNIFHQRLGWDGSYRVVRSSVPSAEELGLPPVCRTLTEYHQGMVLVTGPTNSGKTTTLAAMVDMVNADRDDHIITVEDPIEYVHARKRCQVTQREVGRHTDSFGKALRAALREDPDIIMIGELRDRETVSISISAAETGHLVFGSLHTSSAARTVSRILDVFPPTQQTQICTMISESIRGILSQQLVPKRDGSGVALALEILIFTSGVAQLVREGKTYQLQNQIQSGKKLGMCLMDDSLMELYQAGVISGPEAYSRSDNKNAFELIKNDV